MSRDVKKSRGSNANGGGSSLLTGLLIGLFVGVAVAVGVALFLSRGNNPFAGKTKTTPPDAVTTTPAPAAAQPEILRPGKGRDEVLPTVAASTPGAAPQTRASGTERFDFYKMLSGNEKADNRKPQEAAPKAEAPKGTYLQVGAFQKEEDADNLKAKLALIGIEARIQTTDIPDKGLWHRVRVGPFANAADLDRTRDTLKQNGIDSAVVKAN